MDYNYKNNLQVLDYLYLFDRDNKFNRDELTKKINEIEDSYELVHIINYKEEIFCLIIKIIKLNRLHFYFKGTSTNSMLFEQLTTKMNSISNIYNMSEENDEIKINATIYKIFSDLIIKIDKLNINYYDYNQFNFFGHSLGGCLSILSAL